VWGKMPAKDRENVLKDFKNNKIQAVASCGVLTEGFDEPQVNCIVMARPTKSKTLYTQSVGRGLRIFPTKEDCLVLDFADDYHDLNSIMSLKKSVPQATVHEQKTFQLKKKANLLQEQLYMNIVMNASTFLDKQNSLGFCLVIMSSL